MLCWPRARADFRGVGVEVWVTRFACEDSTAPCVPRSRAREKRCADGREMYASQIAKDVHFVHVHHAYILSI